MKNKLFKAFAFLSCLVVCFVAFALPTFAWGNPENPGDVTGYRSISLQPGYYQIANNEWRDYLNAEQLLYDMYVDKPIIEFNRCFAIDTVNLAEGYYYQTSYHYVGDTNSIVKLTVYDMYLSEFEGVVQCNFTIAVYVDNQLIWVSADTAQDDEGGYPPISISWAVSVPSRPSSTILSNALFFSAIDTTYNDTSSAFQSGYDDGYRLGLIEGQTQSNSVAYDAGYNAGLAVGIAQGAADAELQDGTFSSFFSAILFTPFNVFQEMFDFDFLGTNLGNALVGIFTVCVVLAVVCAIWKAWRG